MRTWLSFTFSIPLILPKGHQLFIESEIFGESVCLADFNPYCAGVIEGKMKCAGY
jgi:hypothetical protein